MAGLTLTVTARIPDRKFSSAKAIPFASVTPGVELPLAYGLARIPAICTSIMSCHLQGRTTAVRLPRIVNGGGALQMTRAISSPWRLAQI